MGSLRYDNVVIEFDDRLLAHLQVVIAQKIRRGESFFMSWRDAPAAGDGHSSIWIHPAQNLFFTFDGRMPTLNQEWVEALLASANGSKGLIVMAEDAVGQDHRHAAPEGPAAGHAGP